MINFPIKITKVLLVIFIALVTFHISFLSSKKISWNNVDEGIMLNNIPENHYDIILSVYDAAQVIQNTKTEYLFGLPQKNNLHILLVVFFNCNSTCYNIKVKAK
jgi:hypothetical protein